MRGFPEKLQHTKGKIIKCTRSLEIIMRIFFISRVLDICIIPITLFNFKHRIMFMYCMRIQRVSNSMLFLS